MILDLQLKAWLEDGKDIRLGDWKAADVEILNTFQLLTAKPVVYLVKCWQIRRLSKAPQAAGTIHTDFERGFICAEDSYEYLFKELSKYKWIILRL
ncbi:putative Beta-grasp domain, TGS-like domain-containing protein [Rosa chinensis]|uniref:Putative Beta-grasp domain, TGS-like domain-containing protein n=1 Tax=Rosa chinensis TaxID=74649 RepID=A0A2P6S3C9_ROSCH|nr:putative Beta-grasp domain, TGS-like domain-containing protein [Rosa chinensis]PRQ53171.1 putative Beta-grasp domain, TGS-like domain-containing protein [Rosa chinensis]